MLKYGDKILYNGKWEAIYRLRDSLTWNQEAALVTHLKYLEAGRPVLIELGFKEEETMFFRGQPETVFGNEGPEPIRVCLTGLSHWQIFVDNRMEKGTRDTDKLKKRVAKHLSQVEVTG